MSRVGGALRATFRPGADGRIFYGWWIVAAGSVIQIFVGGLFMQAYGAYVVLLQREFGWSRTMLSAAFSMSRAESGLLGPPQGWLIDRFGPRAVMRVGIVLFAAGFIAFSQIQTPVGFFVTFFIIAIGSSFAGFLSITVAVVNWFARRRAVALGISGTGMAIGGLLVPLVVLSLERFGWRATAMASGIVILIIGPLVTELVHHRPEDRGLTPDGLPVPGPAQRVGATLGGDGRHAPNPDFTARQALATPAFWLISLGHASAVLIVSAVMTHVVPHLTETLGYTLAEAGLVVALMTAMQIVGMVAGGLLGDRFDKRLIVVGCMFMHGAGLLFVTFAVGAWMVVAFGVLHGLAWGTRGPLMQALRADYFGRSSFGTIMGFSSLLVMLGATAGPLVPGVLYDVLGNYRAAFTALATLVLAGSLFFVLARKPERPQPAEAVDTG